MKGQFLNFNTFEKSDNDYLNSLQEGNSNIDKKNLKLLWDIKNSSKNCASAFSNYKMHIVKLNHLIEELSKNGTLEDIKNEAKSRKWKFNLDSINQIQTAKEFNLDEIKDVLDIIWAIEEYNKIS